jgi:hypothetical protein
MALWHCHWWFVFISDVDVASRGLAAVGLFPWILEKGVDVGAGAVNIATTRK